MDGEGEDTGGEVDHDDHRCQAVVYCWEQVLPEDDRQDLEGKAFLIHLRYYCNRFEYVGCTGQDERNRVENSTQC